MRKCCLYAWGANSHGQLGLEFQSEQSMLPQEVDLSSIEVDPGCIKKITGGGGHSVLLDQEGRIYSCGWNDRGQAGCKSLRDKVVLGFRQVESLRNESVKDVACGWNGTMALTESGEVYAWGSNSHGQLGFKDNAKTHYEEPRKIQGLDERVKGLAMGLRHSVIVTESGKVLVSGIGNRGQLGVTDKDGRTITRLGEFTRIQWLEDIVEVACGQNHTAAITRSGDIFSWGDNRYGQLGFDSDKIQRINNPTKVIIEKMDEPRLRVGWTHTSVLGKDGSIVTWGRNDYGQLGYTTNGNRNAWIGKAIVSCPKFHQLSIGSEHNVAIAEDRSVYAWGWNEHGNCGDGSTSDVLQPKRVCRFGEAVLVGTGAGHSFALIAGEFSTVAGRQR